MVAAVGGVKPLTEYNTTLLRHDEAWLRRTKFLRVACGTEEKACDVHTPQDHEKVPRCRLSRARKPWDKGTSYPDAGTG